MIDQTSLSQPSSLTSLSNGPITLSNQSITALSNGMSSALSTSLKSLLPTILSYVSNVTGYVNGTNRFTNSMFTDAISGNNPFSMAAASRAISMNVLNRNAYVLSTGRSLGFTAKTASEMSNYLNMMPGGVDILTGQLENAYKVSNRTTRQNPVAMLTEEVVKKRLANRDLETNFIRDLNTGAIMPGAYAKLFRDSNKLGKFTSVEEVKENLLTEEEINKLDLPNDDKGRRARKMMRTYRARVSDRLAALERRRQAASGGFGLDEIEITEGAEKLRKEFDENKVKFNTGDEKERAEALKWLSERGLVSRTDPTKPADEKDTKDINYFKAAFQSEQFAKESGNRPVQSFSLAAVAAQAVNEALTAPLSNSLDQQGAAQEQLNKGVEDFIKLAGGRDRGTKLLQSVLADTTDSDFDANGKWSSLIYSLYDKDKADLKIQNFRSLLGGTEADRKKASKGLAALLSVGYTKGYDLGGTENVGIDNAMGFVRAAKLGSYATHLSGGDEAAGSDLLHLAMSAYNIRDDSNFSSSSEQKILKLLNTASQAGDAFEVLSKSSESATKALNTMGISALDVNGRYTKLSSDMFTSNVELRARMSKHGVDPEDINSLASEFSADVVGSEAGNLLGTLLELAKSKGMSDEEIAKMSKDLTGKSVADIFASADPELLAAYQGLSEDSRLAMAHAGMEYIDKGQFQRAAVIESFDQSKFLEMTSLRKRSKNVDENNSTYKAVVDALGGDALSDEVKQRLLTYDFSTPEGEQEFLRDFNKLSGVNNGALAANTGGANQATTIGQWLDSMTKPQEAFTSTEDVTDSTVDLYNDKPKENGAPGSATLFSGQFEEVATELEKFRADIAETKNKVEKIDTTADTVFKTLGTVATTLSEAAEALSEAAKALPDVIKNSTPP